MHAILSSQFFAQLRMSVRISGRATMYAATGSVRMSSMSTPSVTFEPRERGFFTGFSSFGAFEPAFSICGGSVSFCEIIGSSVEVFTAWAKPVKEEMGSWFIVDRSSEKTDSTVIFTGSAGEGGGATEGTGGSTGFGSDMIMGGLTAIRPGGSGPGGSGGAETGTGGLTTDD
jgi:hypothetical protein